MEDKDNKEYRCPLEYTQRVVGGKWKPIILWHLYNTGINRYGELKRYLVSISHKMLSQQLNELAKDGLIYRKQYEQVPPKVEYSITERGETLIPILKQMNQWGIDNMK